MTAYFNGEFVNREDIRISPDDRGFLFADGLYEVIRSYQGRLFRAGDHFSRLNHGAIHLRLQQTDFSYLESVAEELIARNGLETGDAAVYIQVTRGEARRNHPFPVPPGPLTVYATASRIDITGTLKEREQGISVITVPDIRWARCDMKTVGLTANVLANQAAVERGAGEAVFVRDGVMLECSHSNFMAVFDGVLVTAPASNYILSGITRKVVLEICRRDSIPVEERPVFEKDIHLASELMVLGTISEVIPVVRLNDAMVNDGRPGPVVRKLQAALAREIAML